VSWGQLHPDGRPWSVPCSSVTVARPSARSSS